MFSSSSRTAIQTWEVVAGGFVYYIRKFKKRHVQISVIAQNAFVQKGFATDVLCPQRQKIGLFVCIVY